MGSRLEARRASIEDTSGMGEKVERRLTVIVSADVVGYSRLMGIDEAGTRAALNAHRAELIG